MRLACATAHSDFNFYSVTLRSVSSNDNNNADSDNGDKLVSASECKQQVHATYANVISTEQELTTQVRLLNDIHVGHGDITRRASADTHHGHVLEQLASNGARTNDKVLEIQQLLVERLSKHCNLARIARALLCDSY